MGQRRDAGGSADDEAQWGRWVTHAMRRRLVAFAARYVADPWEAEDVVQETLLRARAGLSSLRARERGEAWLFRICRHAAIDHARSRRVRRTVWAPLDADVADPGAADACAGLPAPSASGQPGSARPGARDAAHPLPLRALPAHQRVLVSLHYVHGRSQAALCRMTGLSPSALRVRLFRARNALAAAAAAGPRARRRDRARGSRAGRPEPGLS